MWPQIPRCTSHGTGYCFCLIGLTPGLRSTTMGTWFLAKPGGPFSAQTSGNSFSSLGGFIYSLLEEYRCHSSSLGMVTAIIRADWLPRVRLTGFLGAKVVCAPRFASKSLPSRGMGHSSK